MTSDCDKLALHFKYCALIALMALIALSTERWSARENFTIYLSNAATMTSLLLGVVAIFYSFVSNDSLSKSLGSISTVSTEVRDTREQIGQYLDLTKEATSAGAANAELLRGASADVTLNLASLSDTLKAVANESHSLQTLIANLPDRMDQLELKFGDVAKALGEKPNVPTPLPASDISRSFIDRFLARSTLSNNLLTYACVLAGREKKEFSIEAVCKAISLNAPNSMAGFLRCMDAMYVIDADAVAGKTKTYTISDVHLLLAERARPYFVEYVEQTYSDRPAQKDEWFAKLKNIEALFP